MAFLVSITYFSILNKDKASPLNDLAGLIDDMALKDRINEIIKAGYSKAEIARAAGKTPSAVTQWLTGETKEIKADSAAGIQAKTGFSAVWIATGKGPRYIKNKDEIDLDNNPAYPAIRRVKFRLSAGASGFSVDYTEDEGAPIVFQKSWYEARRLDPAKLFAVKIGNGSMEPGLYHGDTVVVNTEQITPKDGTVFAVNYEGELVIKRLVRDRGEWWLSSDNPDQTRYPRKLCDENCIIIGEIVHKQSEHI